MLGVAKRIVGDAAMAEDIVHDAFMKVWTRAASFDPSRGSARGWIFSVTRHLALNVVRDTGRTTTTDDPDALADADLSQADPFELHGHSGRVYHCLDQLEPARRRCILHAYVDGYTHAEISEKVGSPLGTVKAWIKRSLAMLRECMG